MKKKLVSIMTILCMVLTLVPATVATSHAATTPPNVTTDTVLDRINELENSLSGEFFTTDGKRANSSSDDRCKVINVLNQNSKVRSLIYNNKGKSGYRPDYNSYLPGHYAHDYGSVSTLGWSCFGFANFAEWYIFSDKCSDSVSTETIAKGITYNYSNSVCRTCDLAQPDVTLSYSDTGKIVVSWPKITGADRYEIYRSTSPDTGFKRIYSGTSVSVTNTKDLASGNAYYYKVRAIDNNKSAANSAYSEVDCLTYY